MIINKKERRISSYIFMFKQKKKRGFKMFNLKKLQHFQIIFILVIFMGLAGLSGNAFAEASANTVGIVDFQLLMSQHPDMATAKETLQAEMEQAQKDFDEKTKAMTAEEKNAYHNQVQQQLNEKQDLLFGNIQAKIIAAVKEVADVKGMSVVVDKNAAIYGGQDITADVGKIITAKK